MSNKPNKAKHKGIMKKGKLERNRDLKFILTINTRYS